MSSSSRFPSPASRGVFRCDSDAGRPGPRGFTIRGGSASAGAGGIQATSGATPTIEDCIARNNVGRFGGGVSGSPLLLRCSILSNTATLTHGGGLYGAPTLRSCIVASNRCTGGAHGGGLYVTGGAATVEDCAFVENAAVFANSDAGAIGMSASGTATIRRRVFFGNSATGGVFQSTGGALQVTSGSLIENCTILDNELSGSSVQGGGVYVRSNTRSPDWSAPSWPEISVSVA